MEKLDKTRRFYFVYNIIKITSKNPSKSIGNRNLWRKMIKFFKRKNAEIKNLERSSNAKRKNSKISNAKRTQTQRSYAACVSLRSQLWFQLAKSIDLLVCGKRWGEAFWKFSKIGNDKYFGLHVSFHFHHIWAKSDQKSRGGYKNTEKMGFFMNFFFEKSIFRTNIKASGPETFFYR